MRRSLVYPILTEETLCSAGLILTACSLPAMSQVEVSEVGIMTFKLNATSFPPCMTSIQPKSDTTAIDEIGRPGSRISSRIANDQPHPG